MRYIMIFIFSVVNCSLLFSQTNPLKEPLATTDAKLESLQKLDPNVRERFKIWDWNADGRIDKAEYSGMGTAAKDADINNDQILLAGEYAEYHLKKSYPAKSSISTKKPQLGKYNCLGYGLNASGGLGGSYVYKGHFFLQSNNQYSANNTTGIVTIIEKQGKSYITFNKGAYSGISGEYKIESDGPRIILTWPPANPGGKTSIQYCTCVK